ncbi:hypothetical protein MMC25_004547 [Agyrium rufum]|nr:hypothetical protein [Agyrium rufum]
MVGIPGHHLLTFDLFDALGLDPKQPSTITENAIKSVYRFASLVVHPDKKDTNSHVLAFPTIVQLNSARDYLLALDCTLRDVRAPKESIARALKNAKGFQSTWSPRARNTPKCCRPIVGHKPIHGRKAPAAPTAPAARNAPTTRTADTSGPYSDYFRPNWSDFDRDERDQQYTRDEGDDEPYWKRETAEQQAEREREEYERGRAYGEERRDWAEVRRAQKRRYDARQKARLDAARNETFEQIKAMEAEIQRQKKEQRAQSRREMEARKEEALADSESRKRAYRMEEREERLRQRSQERRGEWPQHI